MWSFRVLPWLLGVLILVPAYAEEGKGYLDNPNIVNEYGNKSESAAGSKPASPSQETHLIGKPSPTGSGIYFVRSEIEPVTIPTYGGKYYEATVPATLDLAARGGLGLKAITNLNDPAQDYEIYGWLGNILDGRVIMKHTYHDYNGGQAKWMMDLPLTRIMCGSDQHLDVDRHMMETMFRMISDDGLYYMPAVGVTWLGESDSVAPWTEPGVHQVFDVWPNGRALLCMVTWYAHEPNSPGLKANIEKMINGWSRIAFRQDGAAWLPRHFYDGKLPAFEPPPVGGTAVTSQATLLRGVAQYYAMTGYEPARELGEAMVKYWLGPAQILNDDGTWNYHEGTHFHGTTFTLIGLMEWAMATHDTALLEKIRKAYEFAKTAGIPELGWFPEGYPAVHPNTEPCGMGDMVVLASELSAAGVGDYWEDVEHYTRNLLASAQITDSWFIKQRAVDNPVPANPAWKDSKLISADDVADRMIGTFSGMTSACGQFQTVSSHCCTGNGITGLYYAWKYIVAAEGDTLNVNVLLNRASQWADVDSYLPNEGKVVVHSKRAQKLRLRIPSWVQDENKVTCMLDGQAHKASMAGRYLEVGLVPSGATVEVKFPIEERDVPVTIKFTSDKQPKEENHRLRMRGFNVIDIWPRRSDAIFPFFVDPSKRTDQVAMKLTARFAPDDEMDWLSRAQKK